MRALGFPGRAVLLLLLTSAAPAQRPPLQPLRPGQAAPKFSRRDLHGAAVTLQALHGRVVLLNFWATWCGPCLTEMPVFSRWQRSQGAAGLQVVGVAMDDTAALVEQALQRLDLGYPVLMGDAGLATDYGGVLGLPVTVLIGRDGRVLKRYDGAADLAAMQQDVAKALATH